MYIFYGRNLQSRVWGAAETEGQNLHDDKHMLSFFVKYILLVNMTMPNKHILPSDLLFVKFFLIN